MEEFDDQTALCLGALYRGEQSRISGWLARARRLLELAQSTCPEHGYLLLADIPRYAAERDWSNAYDVAAQAAAIGDQAGEEGLSIGGRHVQGWIRLQQGRVAEGLPLLDEVMLTVTAGKLPPSITGLIYESSIDICFQVYALDRAHDWTEAFTHWCNRRPGPVEFLCSSRARRAQVLQLRGEWAEALDEILAAEKCVQQHQVTGKVAAGLRYRRAEVHRLRGDLAAAEEDYRDVAMWGGDPQPGLSMLRVAQGRIQAAKAAIARALIAATDALERVRLLPAQVEIMLAGADVSSARAAARELEEIAGCLGTQILATAAYARGAVELADGNAHNALRSLRDALTSWHRLGATYEVARVRALVAQACKALGDRDGYELELASARATFAALGAASDLVRLDVPTARSRSEQAGGLTSRELQVLELVATGKTNRGIAAVLFLSEKTIDRHLSNIFGKLGVPSRAAATAFAYENRLIKRNTNVRLR